MYAGNFSLPEPSHPIMTMQEFQQLRDLIYAHTYLFYTEAQKPLFERKVRSRLAFLSCASFANYYAVLTNPRQGQQELTHLIAHLAVHETSFFRINGHFSGLQHQVFPALMNAPSGRQTPIRVWSAGCSTGEEPYSIVITFLEMMSHRKISAPSTHFFHVLATDISPSILQKAQEGRYSQKQVKKVQQALLDKYFICHDHYYDIREKIKEFVSFSVFNLVQVETLSNTSFDIIFCRNVLIYFDRRAQAKLLAKFVQMLPEGGYLFLGDAESMHTFPESAQHFEFVESGNAIIYRKRGV